MFYRPIRESDYQPIIAVVDAWWGGRRMADMLPKLFFIHFQDTSFAVEHDGALIAFLIGFVSQSRPDEAYIHFVGVHPDYRKHGVARGLYTRFFDAARQRGCAYVRCVTSPVNTTSIAFHLRMGFQAEPGDSVIDGLAVATDYDGQGESRVRFVRRFAAEE